MLSIQKAQTSECFYSSYIQLQLLMFLLQERINIYIHCLRYYITLEDEYLFTKYYYKNHIVMRNLKHMHCVLAEYINTIKGLAELATLTSS